MTIDPYGNLRSLQEVRAATQKVVSAFSHRHNPEADSGFSALAEAIRVAAQEASPVEYGSLYGFPMEYKCHVRDALNLIASELDALALKRESFLRQGSD